MKLSLVISTILISLFSFTTAVGQEDQDTTTYYGKVIIGEIGLDLVQPMRTYAGRVQSTGVGLVIKGLVQRSEGATLFMGGSFYYHSYESFSVNYIDFFNNVQIEVNEVASTHDLGLDYLIRKYPGWVLGRFELYVEGSLGVKWIYTTISSRDVESGDNLGFDFFQNDLAFNYGANLGLQVYLLDNYFINITAGYFGSTSVTYHGRDEDLSGPDAIDSFRLNTSLTDVLRYNLGLTWTF